MVLKKCICGKWDMTDCFHLLGNDQKIIQSGVSFLCNWLWHVPGRHKYFVFSGLWPEPIRWMWLEEVSHEGRRGAYPFSRNTCSDLYRFVMLCILSIYHCVFLLGSNVCDWLVRLGGQLVWLYFNVMCFVGL